MLSLKVVLLIFLTVSLKSNEIMEVFSTISFFSMIVGVLLLITIEYLSHDTGTNYGCAVLYRAHLNPP